MDDEHDFGWALDKMRDGYKVYRKMWFPVVDWRYDSDSGLIINHLSNPVYTFQASDVLAYDWELAE